MVSVWEWLKMSPKKRKEAEARDKKKMYNAITGVFKPKKPRMTNLNQLGEVGDLRVIT